MLMPHAGSVVLVTVTANTGSVGRNFSPDVPSSQKHIVSRPLLLKNDDWLLSECSHKIKPTTLSFSSFDNSKGTKRKREREAEATLSIFDFTSKLPIGIS
jgi:hypothetical protein